TAGGKLIGFGSSRTGNSGSYDKHVYMTDDGRLVFGVWNGHPDVVSTTDRYNDDRWHHLVATQGPAGMVLYLDGERPGSDPAATSQPYTGYWRIGGDSLGGWPNQPSSAYFHGTVDEAAVYSTQLDADRVAAHHALGSAARDTQPPTAPGEPTATVHDGDVAL